MEGECIANFVVGLIPNMLVILRIPPIGTLVNHGSLQFGTGPVDGLIAEFRVDH